MKVRIATEADGAAATSRFERCDDFHADSNAYGAAVSSIAKSAAGTINLALLELEELKRALASSQKESEDAQLRIDSLTASTARLRQRLIRIARTAAQARHFACHDPLTGLPNRSLLLDRFEQAMIRAARQRKQVALLMMDLDGFKHVNDDLGHLTGDKLLQQAAQRLAASVRAADTACRYGGDEFVVMLPDIDVPSSVASVANKIRTAMSAPYVVDGEVIAVTASVGVAVYPGDGHHYLDLLRHAGLAMYAAKALERPSPYSSVRRSARG